MEINELRKAKRALESEGVRFVRELDNKDMGGIIDSHVGPGGFVWIAITLNGKAYDGDKRQLIQEILRNVAEGMV